MHRITPHSCRLLSLLIVCCGLFTGSGCEVRVVLDLNRDGTEGPTDLLTDRLEAQAIDALASVHRAREVDADTTAEIPPTPEKSPETEQVSYWRSRTDLESSLAEAATESETLPTSVPEALPIDLPAVLRLAGAQNWNIELAAERVREARATVAAAEAMWMPSLIGGFGFTRHDGRLQAADGEVLDVSRSSIFVGGGARTGMAPLAGGAGGPVRLSVDLSLADAIFRPLVARQELASVEARRTATFNDTLQAAALAYFSLVSSQGTLANCRVDLEDARMLASQTKAFVLAGKGSAADTARVGSNVERRRQLLVTAEAALKVSSARLARQLRLDPATTLFAMEDRAVPVALVEESGSLAILVDQALAGRPELAAGQALVDAAESSRTAETWRPWLPHMLLGASAGGFGGGVNDDVNGLGSRSDFDILAVWQLENLGLGNRAAREAAVSRGRQASLSLARSRDDIATEVTTAWHEVQAGRRRIKMTEERLKQAGESLRLHRIRIRGLLGLPLEALQAVESIAQAREARLKAIISYNVAHVRLLRAVGRPVEPAEMP